MGIVAHYFSDTPTNQDRRRPVTFTAAGREYTLESSAGVFSADRLDPGTAVLLRRAPLPTGAGTFLDLGCGYGPITCVLATEAPAATVYAVDVNNRALDLVRSNAATLDITGRVNARRPEDVPADVTFDAIYSNPSIRIGKPALHDMLASWLPRLKPDGRAWLVVGRHLGADSLAAWLTGQGFPTAKHASQKGFRVLEVSASGNDGGGGGAKLA